MGTRDADDVRWKRIVAGGGRVLFRCRDALVPLAIGTLVLLTRRGDFLAGSAINDLLDAIGGAVVATGLAIRLTVLATSGVRRSGVHRRIVAAILYEEGPYGWCRNPLYVGNALVLIGLAMIFDSRWMVFVALPIALLAIASLVAAEERELLRAHGERYRQYCARVPRFVSRALPTLRGLQPDWRRALRKEHGTLFSAASTAILLIATERYARFGAIGPRLGPALLVAWLIAAAGWATIRRWKHAGWLNDDASAAPAAPHAGDVAA
jgi:protein-S-isoprenylcysteine O-methyltransferase Ste14